MSLGNGDSLLAIDHVQVFVADRAAACHWYARILGLVPVPVPELAFWATNGGPLTLSNAARSVTLALFEQAETPHRATVALRVDGPDFLAWRADLAAEPDLALRFEDHAVAWSLYFADPDTNRFEITTYDYFAVAKALADD
ncbi:VOC family protein [Salinisphaera sp. SPP-AMP-43]|uniref:VOC family protein n=1 Tax=Salinisphaera sp. SPP-AMP-43 TaxID=3121288 RepID=UPI003C6E6C6B